MIKDIFTVLQLYFSSNFSLESEPEFYSKHVKIQNTKYPEQTYIRISGLPSQNLVAHHNKDPVPLFHYAFYSMNTLI